MGISILLILLFGLVLLVVVFTIVSKKLGFSLILFFLKGKEEGFTFREIIYILKIVRENQLDNPSIIFWSTKIFDRVLKASIKKVLRGPFDNAYKHRHLQQAFQIRNKFELQQPKYRVGIKRTQEIFGHIKMKIHNNIAGTSFSVLIENNPKHLALSYPQTNISNDDFSWKNQKVKITFWRPDDAEYCFESKVLESFPHKDYPLIWINHSKNLTRLQYRKSIRADIALMARYRKIKGVYESHHQVNSTQLKRGRIIDICENGIGMFVTGNITSKNLLYLEFELGKSTIRVVGQIKGFKYFQEKNVTLLHIEFQNVTVPQQNRILAYVYNIFNERDSFEKNRKKKNSQQKPGQKKNKNPEI